MKELRKLHNQVQEACYDFCSTDIHRCGVVTSDCPIYYQLRNLQTVIKNCKENDICLGTMESIKEHEG